MPPPRDAVARLYEQAFLRHRAGQLDAAEAGYRQVLLLDPRHADAWNYLGVAASQAGRHEAAVEAIGRAIELRRNVADYHDNLGIALRALGRVDEAGNCHRKAIRLDPRHAKAHDHFGTILVQRGQIEDAERFYRAAIERDPRSVEAHNNLGSVLLDLQRPAEAEQELRTALRLHPGFVEAYPNLGSALRNLGRLAEAEAVYRAGLRLAPDLAVLRYNLAGLLLVTGRLAEGWPLYEERLRLAMAPSGPAVPRWRGEPFGDKVLLLHAEQGSGDTIQACRYVTLFPAGTRLVLEVPPGLHRLIGTLATDAILVKRGDNLPTVDLHCPLMSLPGAFGTALDTIPGQTPYLAADPKAAQSWRRRLASLPGPKVGLVWAGAAGYTEDRRRSLPAEMLAAFAGRDDVSFVSLQKPARPAPLAMIDWTEELGDFADTAALIAGLDLIIGVDTAVVHLAGALGRPVWLLNRFDPHWVWLLERVDSPWYPTLRQFRQSRPGDWPGVIAAAVDALAQWAADRAEDGADSAVQSP
jgi:Flp pilus assembly protein TadD